MRIVATSEQQARPGEEGRPPGKMYHAHNRQALDWVFGCSGSTTAKHIPGRWGQHDEQAVPRWLCDGALERDARLDSRLAPIQSWSSDGQGARSCSAFQGVVWRLADGLTVAMCAVVHWQTAQRRRCFSRVAIRSSWPPRSRSGQSTRSQPMRTRPTSRRLCMMIWPPAPQSPSPSAQVRAVRLKRTHAWLSRAPFVSLLLRELRPGAADVAPFDRRLLAAPAVRRIGRRCRIRHAAAYTHQGCRNGASPGASPSAIDAPRACRLARQLRVEPKLCRPPPIHAIGVGASEPRHRCS